MKEKLDYIKDIAEMRSMMERSSKFLSLSGWAGIMAGIYALLGAFIAYRFFNFNKPDEGYSAPGTNNIQSLQPIILLALAVLFLAGATAVFFSAKNAQKSGEKLWNATSRRLLINTSVPMVAGAILIIILVLKGFFVFAAPLSLVFYGLALYNGSKFTYNEIRILGLVQICLGLLCTCFIEWSLLFWALGFGLVHIVYGIYMQYRYQK